MNRKSATLIEVFNIPSVPHTNFRILLSKEHDIRIYLHTNPSKSSLLIIKYVVFEASMSLKNLRIFQY